MSADFANPGNCGSQSAKRNFGICDDANRSPAYLDETNGDHWIAEIDKADDRVIKFVAIDYCLDTRRPNGELDNRCDGMLLDGPSVIFVELKERDTDRPDWVAKGVKQLRASIRHFEATPAAAAFRQKLAYIANSERPSFVDSKRSRQEDFLAETGYVLAITPHIRL